MKPGNEVRLLCLSDKERGKLENVLRVLKKFNLKSSWITKNDAMKAEKEDDVMYVVEPTEGKIVDHLVENGCSVIGSQCALTVLEEDVHLNKSLTFPIISLNMMDTLVCFSNIKPKMRNYLIDMVKKMGGRVESELTQYVTHLVVKEVGSAKYFGAARHNIPIMTIEWIRHLWKMRKDKYVCAMKESWDAFVCPILLGCSICVTGFNFEDREEIKKLVDEYGGSYSGAMKLDVTTHLIVKKAEGAKYEMAGKFGVKVVSRSWLLDSIEKKSCQDHNKYPVKPEGQKEIKQVTRSSTPEPQASFSKAQPLNDMSCISVMAVNETEQSMDVSCISSQMGKMLGNTRKQPTEQSQSSSQYAHDLMNFKPTDISSDLLLDGVCVYYTGFKQYEEDQLKNLLNLAGGTRCMQITNQITHVLMGPRAPEPSTITSITSLLNDGCLINVVNYKWLLDSLRRGELLTEEEYWPKEVLRRPSNDMDAGGDLLENDTVMVPEDLDETRLPPNICSMVKRQQQVDETYQNTTVQETRYENTTIASANKSQHDGIVGSEHIGDSTLLRNYEEVEEENRNPAAPPPCKSDFSDISGNTSKMDETEQDSFSSRNPRVLRNKKVMVFGMDDREGEIEELLAKIEWMGGQLVPKSRAKGKADIAVVPMNGWNMKDISNIKLVVTGFWIENCIVNNSLVEVDSHPLNTPFDLSSECHTILTDTCICPSRYEEQERTYLVELIKLLGGRSQSDFARKNIASSGGKELVKTTHLMVETPAGNKYTTSIKWEIPAVTSQWIYACARQRKLVDEAPYNPALPPQEAAAMDETYSLPSEAPSTSCMGPPSTSNVVKRNSKDFSSKPPSLQFQPMPRPPSAVDQIRKKLMEREQAAGKSDTPLCDRVLRYDLESPSNFIGTKSTPNTSFDLTEVFEMLGTPQNKRKEIVDELNKNSSDKSKYQTPPNLPRGRNHHHRTGSSTAFDLDDVFEMLKTPHDEQQIIRRQISNNPNTPLSVFVRRLFVKSLKDKPNMLENDIVMNLSRQFDEASSDDQENIASAAAKQPQTTPQTHVNETTTTPSPSVSNDTRHLNTSSSRRESLNSKSGTTTPNISNKSGATTPNISNKSGATTPNISNKSGATTPNISNKSGATTPNISNKSGATTLTMRRSTDINEDDLLTSDIVANLEHDFDDEEFEQVASNQNNPADVDVEPTAVDKEHSDDDGDKQLVEVVNQQDTIEREEDEEEETLAPPLADCVVYVAKKLSKQREKLSELVEELGGEFRSTYDSSCTHFIFQGKQNDTNREFRTAKKQEDVIVVSPHWLDACANMKKKVEECEYPHVFNPNKSIEMTGMSSQQRSISQSKRNTRNSRNSTANVEPSMSVTTRRTRGGNRRTTVSVSREMSQVSEISTISQSGESTMSPTLDSQEARESIRKALENAASLGMRMEENARKARKKSPPAVPFTRKRSVGSDNSTITPTTSMLMGREPRSEYSQDVQVGYDDPVGRMEREKLLKEKRLSLNGSLITVREETEGAADEEDEYTPEGEEADKQQDDDRLSQVCDDDRLSQLIRDGKKPIFILSSIKAAQKNEYAQLIEQLGGTYLTRDYFDDLCTHLVVAHPTRNEKFLASLATGKFVLHTSYLDACKEAGFFVKEDTFEYGNPLATINFQPKDEMEKSLTDSAYRWRKSLCQRKRTREYGSPLAGAFSGWKVAFQVSSKYKMSLTRIIKSGGGSVEGYALYDDIEYTHAIISADRCDELDIDAVKSLLERGVHCCLSDYVAEFLIYHPSPKPEVRYIPAAKSLKDKMSSALGLGTKVDSNQQNGTPVTKRRRVK